MNLSLNVSLNSRMNNVSEKSGLPLNNIELVLSHFISRLKISELVNFDNKESMRWFLKGIKRLSEDYTSGEISRVVFNKKDMMIEPDTGAPKLLYVKILIGILFSDDFKNGEAYLTNLLMGFFEENSITGTVYLNTYQEIESMNKKHLDKESIEYLTKPINRFTFVSDDKTIKAIKDKVRYYSKTYGVPTDRYINISNTLLLSILQKIQQSPKYASGKIKKSKSKSKSKRTRKQTPPKKRKLKSTGKKRKKSRKLSHVKPK